jgi:formate hydrogenlyase subunit 6/NADH:ubiquinone oxidoreductase subunit I
MGKFGILDRFRIPTYDDPEHMQFGVIEFDYARCTMCSICVNACPADAIVAEDKSPRMRPGRENVCMFCGDCAAICPSGAISMKLPYSFTRYFKTVDRGQISPPRL